MLREMFWNKHPVQSCPLNQFVLHCLLLRLTREKSYCWKAVRGGVQLCWQATSAQCPCPRGSSSTSPCCAGNRGTATPSGVPSCSLLGQAQRPTLPAPASPSHRPEGWHGGCVYLGAGGAWLPGRQHSWASALLETWKMQHKASELPFLKDLRGWLLAHPYKNRRFSVLV